MTDTVSDSDERIHRLLLTLSVNASHLDTQQLKGWLYDLRKQVQSEEIERVVGLVEASERRIVYQKGLGYRAELERLVEEIEKGTQRLVGTY